MKVTILLRCTVVLVCLCIFSCGDSHKDTGGINLEALAESTQPPKEKADQMMQALTNFFQYLLTVTENQKAIETINEFNKAHGPAMQTIAKEFTTWSQNATEEELQRLQKELMEKPYYRQLDNSLDSLSNRMLDNPAFQEAMTKLMQLTQSEPEEALPEVNK
ncbi:MAG: hypothetical protein EBS07_08300 [Sphingobacteriia bacterium]|nr:hypothetical protein [Sphingobacteriia bacterium]